MSNTVMPEVREKYVQRFADMLEPLQSRLTELEQNLDSIKDDHPDKQKARLDVLTEINKTKFQIENAKKNLECSRDIPIVRSDKVSENISDYYVWNDCWYDEKRKAFVTLNKYFEKSIKARDREIQIQYNKEMNTLSGIIIEEEKIQFRFGYPVIQSKNQDNQTTWCMLPTLQEKMLTKEIVKGRLNSESDEKSIFYITDSEPWIEVLDTKLSEREYELACEVVPHLVKTPMEVLKATAGRPYDKKLFEKQMTQINSKK
ncbi:MAG: hypothetical protein KC483_09060 [Nitrosarchaeum sp.]|nr:hypothetical protein [Nitrosarchaeum sp.]MCA9820667.1 hypothetical protein [Nitrosarchaeum sp.]